MDAPISGLITETIMLRMDGIALPLIELKVWTHNVENTFVILKHNAQRNPPNHE